jgi:pullulanase
LLEVLVSDPIDMRYRVLALVDGYRPSNAVPRNVLFDREKFYRDVEMGAIYSPEATTFRVFAPAAESVDVLLYSSSTGVSPNEEFPMSSIGAGIWETKVSGDLHERPYRFGVRGDGDAITRHDAVDIHARALTGHDGHGLVLDMRRTDPPGFRPIVRPANIKSPTDAIIVEYSVRDFTRDLTSGVPADLRGKFLGFAERGTTAPGTSISTGIDHLVELGVTHVQILPIHDFDNREDSDEYNWGYMTANFSSPDGWYATDHRCGVRVTEAKAMVKALHDAGIRVIMDVVYNHTAPTSTFESIAPRYYHRRHEDGRLWNGSGCGNEFHSEAPMARKFIVDSCLYWVREYGVDGFRFDLMGLIDMATLMEIKVRLHEIDPTLLIYGEPWAATGPDGTGIRRITYKDVVAGSGIGAFNDHFRNALKGSPDGDEPGYVQGAGGRDGVKKGLQGSIHDWAREPGESIQYATCHDNLCLYDKLELSLPEEPEEELLELVMLTNGLLAMSQGVMFLHGGEEFARTKLGNHNSYNAPDSVNAVNWLRKKKYHAVFEYTRNMIAIRRQHPVFRLSSREQIERRLSFRDDWCPTTNCIAMRLDGKGLEGESWSEVLVLVNPEFKDHHFPLPGGVWHVYAQGHLASPQKLLSVTERIPTKGRSLVLLAR